MGKIKYIKKIREFFKKNLVVDVNSLKRFISRRKKDYVYLLINKMIKKGEIKRITRGYYTVNEDPVLAVFCFKPAYLGLQNALSIHNLWEQETNPMIITIKKIRQGRREIFGSNVILKRLNSRYFFGVEYMKEGGVCLPVSDIEKSFIDMIYFKQGMDKQVLRNFKRKIDTKKLKKYLRNYPKKISDRVLRSL